MFSIYLAIGAASHVHFCPDAEQLVRVIGQVHPTAFFGVPRVWERIGAGIQALLAAEQDAGKRAAVAGGHGDRPPLRAQLPVRAGHAAGARAPSSGRRTSRCSGRSAACSA